MIVYYPLMIFQAIWNRDEFCFRQFFFDCYPETTLEESHIAFILACGARPLYRRLLPYYPDARASRQGPSRPRSDITVGRQAVNSESERQLTLPL